MLTTEGTTLLTNVRRSRFRFSRAPTSLGSTVVAAVARVYFSGAMRASKFKPPCLRR